MSRTGAERASNRLRRLKLTCDLLVEIDLTARPSYNREKFLAYGALLALVGVIGPVSG